MTTGILRANRLSNAFRRYYNDRVGLFFERKLPPGRDFEAHRMVRFVHKKKVDPVEVEQDELRDESQKLAEGFRSGDMASFQQPLDIFIPLVIRKNYDLFEVRKGKIKAKLPPEARN